MALNLLELASDRLRLLFDPSQGETERGCHRRYKEQAAGWTVRFGIQAGQDISLLFPSLRLTLEPDNVVFNGYRFLSWGKEAGA